MSLKRSSSVLAACAALAIGAGCARTLPPAAPGAPVTVHWERVERAHPLQDEVGRLRAAEAALAALEQSAARAAPRTGRWTEEKEGAGPGVADRLAAGIAQRRAFARERLRQSVEAGLSAYFGEAQRRVEGLVAQRRSELEAVERDRQAQEESRVRAAVDAETRRQVERLAGDVAMASATEAALTEQLDRTRGVLWPVSDVRAHQLAVARLLSVGSIETVRSRADLQRVFGLVRPDRRRLSPSESARLPGPDFRPGDRARLEVLARAVENYRRDLLGRVEQVYRDAEEQRRRAAEAARQQPLEAIEAQLEELRGENEPAFLVEETGRAVERTLGLEALVAARTGPGRLAGGKPPEPGVAVHPPIERVDAGRRVRERRQLLARLVQEDARAAVRDTARRRGWTLVAPPRHGAPDRTEWFVQNMRLK